MSKIWHSCIHGRVYLKMLYFDDVVLKNDVVFKDGGIKSVTYLWYSKLVSMFGSHAYRSSLGVLNS